LHHRQMHYHQKWFHLLIFNMYMRHTHNKAGFTLIELLVVIAIIGILSSVVLASLNSARTKSRDARRLSDMKQVQLALELYYDSNNAYPGPWVTTWGEGGCSWDSSGRDTDNDGKPWLEPLSDQGFIPTVPLDPQNTGDCGAPSYAYYRYGAGSYSCDLSRGAYFVLGVRDMETSARPHPSSPGFSCSGRDWQTEFDWVVGGFEF